MKQHTPFYRKPLVLIVITLAISLFSSCSENEQTWKVLNNEILNTILQKKCETVNIQNGYGYIILEQRGFTDLSANLDCFDDSIREVIFTKENKQFFKEQLSRDINYTNLISESNCIKKTLPEDAIQTPGYCDSRCFKISTVVFTKDYQYALFFITTTSTTSSLYKLENGKYVPFKGCFLSIS